MSCSTRLIPVGVQGVDGLAEVVGGVAREGGESGGVVEVEPGWCGMVLSERGLGEVDLMTAGRSRAGTRFDFGSRASPPRREEAA